MALAVNDFKEGIQKSARFRLFALLCDQSYSQVKAGENLFQQAEDWEFRAGPPTFGRSIWVWHCTARPAALPVDDPHRDVTHVVVIRGTKTIFDWLKNYQLARASMEADNIFINIVNDYLAEIERFFSHKNLPTVNVWLTGHSLGAALAEALTAIMRQKKIDIPNYPIKVIGAVTFDSPGLPTEFCHRHHSAGGFQPRAPQDDSMWVLSNLWTLNSSPNIVNTFNSPSAEVFYGCGKAFEITETDVIMFTLQMWSSTALGMFNLLKANTEQHYMKAILQYLGGDDIHEESAKHWVTISKNALLLISGSYMNFVHIASEFVKRLTVVLGATTAVYCTIHDAYISNLSVDVCSGAMRFVAGIFRVSLPSHKFILNFQLEHLHVFAPACVGSLAGFTLWNAWLAPKSADLPAAETDDVDAVETAGVVVSTAVGATAGWFGLLLTLRSKLLKGSLNFAQIAFKRLLGLLGLDMIKEGGIAETALSFVSFSIFVGTGASLGTYSWYRLWGKKIVNRRR